jgi:hypothetical protein
VKLSPDRFAASCECATCLKTLAGALEELSDDLFRRAASAQVAHSGSLDSELHVSLEADLILPTSEAE